MRRHRHAPRSIGTVTLTPRFDQVSRRHPAISLATFTSSWRPLSLSPRRCSCWERAWSGYWHTASAAGSLTIDFPSELPAFVSASFARSESEQTTAGLRSLYSLPPEVP
jgi:hypothetical protein